MREHTTHHDDCGCQSAAQTARIATLEAELSGVRQASATELAHAYAHANALRDALEKLACLGNGDLPGNSEGNVIAQRALAANAVPAASLAAHDAEVLERAAVACETMTKDIVCPEECAAVIRALAAQEVKP